MNRFINDNKIINEDEISRLVYEDFKEGDKIAKKDLKDKLNNIYKYLGINKNAKANDINKWFETKSTSIRLNGKLTSCFELFKRRE